MKIFLLQMFEKYFKKNPFVIIDIGASGGIPKLWKSLHNYLRVIAFEPNPIDYVKLSNRRVKGYQIKYFNTALANEKKIIKFYLTKNPQLSSMFHPNKTILDKFDKGNGWNIDRSIEMECDALDNQLIKNQIIDIDLIKIDTQGTELLILEGSVGILNNSIFGIESEVEFAPIYCNQPLYSDLDIFLRKYRFQLVEIIRTKYWKKPIQCKFVESNGQIVYGDVLYLKDTDAFLEMVSKTQDEFSRKSKILKAVVISILYKHMDYGFEIIERAIQSAFFDNEEEKILKKYMRSRKEVNIDIYFYNKINRIENSLLKKILLVLFSKLYNLYNGFKEKENRWINGAIWK